MKKLICIFAAAILTSLCFAGCGEKNNNGSMSSTLSETATDASKTGSSMMEEAQTMASQMGENGEVSDGDGIIGNENSESNSEIKSDTDSSNNNNSTSTSAVDDEM